MLFPKCFYALWFIYVIFVQCCPDKQWHAFESYLSTQPQLNDDSFVPPATSSLVNQLNYGNDLTSTSNLSGLLGYPVQNLNLDHFPSLYAPRVQDVNTVSERTLVDDFTLNDILEAPSTTDVSGINPLLSEEFRTDYPFDDCLLRENSAEPAFSGNSIWGHRETVGEMSENRGLDFLLEDGSLIDGTQSDPITELGFSAFNGVNPVLGEHERTGPASASETVFDRRERMEGCIPHYGGSLSFDGWPAESAAFSMSPSAAACNTLLQTPSPICSRPLHNSDTSEKCRAISSNRSGQPMLSNLNAQSLGSFVGSGVQPDNSYRDIGARSRRSREDASARNRCESNLSTRDCYSVADSRDRSRSVFRERYDGMFDGSTGVKNRNSPTTGTSDEVAGRDRQESMPPSSFGNSEVPFHSTDRTEENLSGLRTELTNFQTHFTQYMELSHTVAVYVSESSVLNTDHSDIKELINLIGTLEQIKRKVDFMVRGLKAALKDYKIEQVQQLMKNMIDGAVYIQGLVEDFTHTNYERTVLLKGLLSEVFKTSSLNEFKVLLDDYNKNF